MKIQTEILNLSVDNHFLSALEQKVAKLQHFFSLITEVKVVLRPDETQEVKKGQIVELKLHLPNGIIFIKESSKSFETALDKALIAIKLQLLRYRAKRQSYCLI